MIRLDILKLGDLWKGVRLTEVCDGNKKKSWTSLDMLEKQAADSFNFYMAYICMK